MFSCNKYRVESGEEQSLCGGGDDCLSQYLIVLPTSENRIPNIGLKCPTGALAPGH